MQAPPGQLDDRTIEVLRSGLRIVALRALGDADLAEEISQEALVRGLEALREGRINRPENLGAYFRGIVRHIIADTIRERNRTVPLEGLPEQRDENPASDALGALITKEQRAEVARVMAELSPKARECLTLCFFHGLPPREVAIRLGEPASRIRKRRSRALERIREILRDGKGGNFGHETMMNDTARTEVRRTEGPSDMGVRDEG